MNDKSKWTVHIPKDANRLINMWADAYVDSVEPSQKRNALAHYLTWISVTHASIEAELFGSILLNPKRTHYFNLRPLQELKALLADLENGERPELFSPISKATGRSPLARKKQMWWARASFVMTWLMNHNKPEVEAAKEKPSTICHATPPLERAR